MEARELLEKYNPVLIIFPQDPELNRPGAVTRGRGRGDYHPCSVELFLSLVVWRERAKSWFRLPILKLLPQLSESAIGLEGLRLKTLANTPGATLLWELDIEPIRSQNSRQAWQALRDIYSREDLKAYVSPTVYARLVQGSAGPVLQYWYLYLYNDAPNKHEGDWEMVSLQLNAANEPVTAAYAGHAGGYKRDWPEVEKEGSDRPRVYVARGSHAAYFAYRARGYRTNSLSIPKNLWPPLQRLVSAFYDLVRSRWPFWDHLAALPEDANADPLERGQRLDIPAADLVMLPEVEGGSPGTPFWWQRLRGKWGSRHWRGFGTIAPDPPWIHGKWGRPSEWIAECPPDPGSA
jgi:hypothetical protein